MLPLPAAHQHQQDSVQTLPTNHSLIILLASALASNDTDTIVHFKSVLVASYGAVLDQLPIVLSQLYNLTRNVRTSKFLLVSWLVILI